MQEIIEKLKAYALAHYNEGFDTFVECYDDKAWEEFVKDIPTYEEALQLLKDIASVHEDRRLNAEKEIF